MKYKTATDLIYQDKITCRIDGKLVLDEVPVSIQKNKTLVIVGPGNSGKSTLLNFLADELTTEAHIATDRKDAITNKIGYYRQREFEMKDIIFEEAFLKKNLDIKMAIDETWKYDKKIAEDLIMGTSIKSHDLPGYLKALLGFTLFEAMNHKNPIWFLDEPEVGLHGEPLEILSRKIKQHIHQRTIVIVTHNIQFAKQVADEIMFLKYGNLIEHSSKDDFVNSKNPDVQYILKMGC